MNLLEELAETFAFLEKTHSPDGQGGIKVTYTRGMEFKATASFPDGNTAKIADKLTEKQNCDLMTSKAIALEVGDVVLAIADNSAYRILSANNRQSTPISSMLNMRKYHAEMIDISDLLTEVQND